MEELDEADTAAALVLLQSRVDNAHEARERCAQLLQTQLELAQEQRPPPNEPIAGDSRARGAMLLLLDDERLRELFLQTARKPSNWARLRPLFGAPPFHFLRPHDTDALRAAGFARNRKNMAYDDSGRAASYAQFGAGQLKDDMDRKYRFHQLADRLPGTDTLATFAGQNVPLQVRLPKRSLRRAQYKERAARVPFPRVGERLHLQNTRQLLTARGIKRASDAEVIVKRLIPREEGAHTALMMVSPVEV